MEGDEEFDQKTLILRGWEVVLGELARVSLLTTRCMVEKGLEELECTVVKKRVSVSFLPFFPQCL